MPGDFEIGLNRKMFNANILGGDPDMHLPSYVPVLAAYNALRKQEDCKWKLLPEDLISKADSLHVDVDSGIFSMSASPLTGQDLISVVISIEALLPVEMRGKMHNNVCSEGQAMVFLCEVRTQTNDFSKWTICALAAPRSH